MPGIGIITNPHSKMNKRKPHTAKVLGYILGHHGRLAVTQSLKDLRRVAEKFRDNNIEILAINGGDGTISRTLTAIIHAYGDKPLPKIALLRGGTMNVLAGSLGIKGSPEKLLYRLCERYSDGESTFQTTTRSTLSVNNHFGFLYADGISCSILAEFYRNKTGAMGAAWLCFRVALSAIFRGRLFRKVINGRHCSLDAAGHPPLTHSTLAVLAATIDRFPFGFRVFPFARRRAEEFQFISVTLPPESLLWRLPKLLFHHPEGISSGKISHTSSSLSVKCDDRFAYTLDGELLESDKESLDVTVGPTIEFIVV